MTDDDEEIVLTPNHFIYIVQCFRIPPAIKSGIESSSFALFIHSGVALLVRVDVIASDVLRYLVSHARA